MKHLIIYAHPIQTSLNAQLKDHLEATLREAGHEVVLRDLYQLGFNPVLSATDINGQREGRVEEEVLREQNWISWAEAISLIYPIWWTGLPSIMKGYIDRVFSYGFAYRYDKGVQKGLLQGKQVAIVNTQGKSKEQYRKNGMDSALLRTSDTGIYAYCGLEIRKHLFFDQADRAGAEQLHQWREQIKALW